MTTLREACKERNLLTVHAGLSKRLMLTGEFIDLDRPLDKPKAIRAVYLYSIRHNDILRGDQRFAGTVAAGFKRATTMIKDMTEGLKIQDRSHLQERTSVEVSYWMVIRNHPKNIAYMLLLRNTLRKFVRQTESEALNTYSALPGTLPMELRSLIVQYAMGDLKTQYNMASI